jgi:S1-C subfamily serine protease
VESKAIASLAASLLSGALPEAQPWDVAVAVRSIADALAGGGAAVTAPQIRAAANALNKARQYDHTRVLAEAWRDRVGFDATVTKHHAQALINLSALDAAERLLLDGRAQAGHEALEYEGLLGRVAKQRFVATGDLDALMAATDQYLAQYEGPRKPFWHGINAAALRACEERAALDRPGKPSAGALAAAVLEQVLQAHALDSSDPWLPATASEAYLALADCERAELWLYRFLHHRNVSPFAVESYERQVREVWKGSALGEGTSCADKLAGILARHVARTQARLSVAPADVSTIRNALERDPKGFEKNFSGEGSFSVDTVQKMLNACASIGCISDPRGERLGTGFLVPGDQIHASFGPGPVLVTNAHVISDTVPKAVRPNDARVSFETEEPGANGPTYYRVSEVLFSSAPGDLGIRSQGNDLLDATIVRLDAPAGRLPCLKISGALPLIEPKAKAYVVGHPLGSGLQISLHDSRLLDIDDDERLVHYRTPTDPGNSGSPVFNATWEVMALHHGGSSTTPRLHGQGSYEANEAIALSAIRRKLGA